MPSKRVSLKGKGADLFFGDYTPPTSPASDVQLAEPAAPLATESEPEENHPENTSATTPRHRRVSGKPASASDELSRDMSAEPLTPSAPRRTRKTARNGASTLASSDVDTIEAIRKVVKATGREVSFVRLSPDEKARLADIVYTYKRQGVKTSENEINRIAINLLLADYDTNGESSTLARVLAALQA